MTDRPSRVLIREEGPREGFQIEPVTYPLADRVALVEALAGTGLAHIQVASFVSPKRVPQMADSAALFHAVRKHPGVHYTALWLNEQGYERARACPAVDLEARLPLCASDAFSRRNNGASAAEMLARTDRWLDLYAVDGLGPGTATVMAAFGCNFEGEVPVARVVRLVRDAVAMHAERGAELPVFTLADTMGWATPDHVRRLVGELRAAMPAVTFALHLHDTRGLGIANAAAGLDMGIERFDAAVAGLGGCPFSSVADAPAAGNVCTEDLAFLCEEMGIGTGIDLDALIGCARLAERIIGRPLNGRLMKAGTLARFRA